MPCLSTAFICLGSNQGKPEENISNACEILENRGILDQKQFYPVSIINKSSLYYTEPQLYTNQPFFSNQVIKISVSQNISPATLLQNLLDIESLLGRDRSGPRFGPRIIDLDLLLFNSVEVTTPLLILPHPRMLERAFVLVPLAEIAPELVLPQGITVTDALKRITYNVKNLIIYQS